LKKEQKYYGEVWFEDSPEQRQFCVLSFDNDNLVLETNLHNEKSYKVSQILGAFAGLGYFTFIDCLIKFSSSGITEARVYWPKYSFRSDSHFINIEELRLKEFFIVNDSIVKWVNFANWYDKKENKLLKKEFTDKFQVDEIGLKIEIRHYINYKMPERSEFIVSNRGAVNFELEETISLLKGIELYDQFQKLLHLTFGGSSKFRKFSFKCTGCDEWVELYYNDKKFSVSTTTFVHTNYKEIKLSLPKLFTAIFSNQNFQFCLDKLMENFIGKQLSHNKRFINSIAAFEAYNKLFSDTTNNKLSKWILEHQQIFRKIGGITDEDWKEFASKVVRSRDYHIHSNIGNKDIYSEFDLLYLSFLFDFVIAYLLLKKIEVDDKLLNKYVQHGNSVYIDMKRTNAILKGDSEI